MILSKTMWSLISLHRLFSQLFVHCQGCSALTGSVILIFSCVLVIVKNNTSNLCLLASYKVANMYVLGRIMCGSLCLLILISVFATSAMLIFLFSIFFIWGGLTVLLISVLRVDVKDHKVSFH